MSAQRKLIRDRIPEILAANGKSCVTRPLATHDFIQELKNKLVEEAQELKASEGRREIVDELADLAEVYQSLLDAYGISQDEVECERKWKRERRGSFDNRLLLLEVAENSIG